MNQLKRSMAGYSERVESDKIPRHVIPQHVAQSYGQGIAGMRCQSSSHWHRPFVAGITTLYKLSPFPVDTFSPSVTCCHTHTHTLRHMNTRLSDANCLTVSFRYTYMPPGRCQFLQSRVIIQQLMRDKDERLLPLNSLCSSFSWPFNVHRLCL